MPFTFAHPAIVLPLKKLLGRWFSLTGLVIGSMTPDFEYFFRMSIFSTISHRVAGVFFFDLPVGILLAFLFHNIVRNPFFGHLPLPLRERLVRFTSFNWNGYFSRHWFVVIISVVTGAFSHLLWDNFTHRYGWFVNAMPVLKHQIGFENIKFPITTILQHLSTALGTLAMVWVIWRMPGSRAIPMVHATRYWATVAGVVSIVLTLRFIHGIDFTHYGDIVVSCISAFFAGLVVAGVGDRVLSH